MTSKTEQFYIQHIAELEKQLKQRDERIATLEKQVAELTDKVAKLSKNSSNSSKPPSSDIVKPPRKKKAKVPVTLAANPDTPNTNERLLQKTKLMIFKLIRLMPALIVAANFKRLKTPPKLSSRLKLLKSRFTLNNISAFATGASIARSFTTHQCRPILKKDN